MSPGWRGYSPASQLLQGTVDVQQLRPSALHSALDRQAVQGRLQAQHSSDGAVQFVVDLRGERGERPPAMAPVAEGGSATLAGRRQLRQLDQHLLHLNL